MRERQTLIIDADDTLWENNIYFESAFDDFCDFLNHSTLSPRQVRDILDELEAVNAKVHGYGSVNFGRNLQQVYERLCERHIARDDLAAVMRIAERILDQPIELIEGVAETLEYLSMRHDLTLFTKGSIEEQKLKVDRSGLGVYFGHTAIVKEKDADSYRTLLHERRMDTRRSWMIGNSPKSDVNPALEVGMNAVFIPHAHTWILEKQEVRNGGPGRLLRLDHFAELRNYF
jgi:putative hydrolase of the HAD superfamily